MIPNTRRPISETYDSPPSGSGAGNTGTTASTGPTGLLDTSISGGLRRIQKRQAERTRLTRAAYPDLAEITDELRARGMFGTMAYRLPKVGLDVGQWDIWSSARPLGWGVYKQYKHYRRHSGKASTHGTDREEYRDVS